VDHYFDGEYPLPDEDSNEWVIEFARILYKILPAYEEASAEEHDLPVQLDSAWSASFPDSLAEAYTIFIMIRCPNIDTLSFTGDLSQAIDLNYPWTLLHGGPQHVLNSNEEPADFKERKGLEDIPNIRTSRTRPAREPPGLGIDQAAQGSHQWTYWAI
jgi:hypothetical protein